jgi:Cell division protein CrgA
MPQSKSKRSRYTPPSPTKAPPSQLWVPVVMATTLAAGLVVIVTNYLELLPGDTSNRYLLLGLVLIVCGFMLATIYR